MNETIYLFYLFQLKWSRHVSTHIFRKVVVLWSCKADNISFFSVALSLSLVAVRCPNWVLKVFQQITPEFSFVPSIQIYRKEKPKLCATTHQHSCVYLLRRFYFRKYKQTTCLQICGLRKKKFSKFYRIHVFLNFLFVWTCVTVPSSVECYDFSMSSLLFTSSSSHIARYSSSISQFELVSNHINS